MVTGLRSLSGLFRHRLIRVPIRCSSPVGPSPDPASITWLQATPQMLRGYLQQLMNRWPSSQMYISEFGMDEPFESMRTELFQILEDTTTTTLLAVHEDGIPLMGTFSWAMIDNAEWIFGLEPRFGIQHVNYTTLERTYKCSAYALCDDDWKIRVRRMSA
ncbi:glycoside hydrolase superfamily [Boletus edulis]|nr:glycoside hydrolase superfamily [Boletus edulis]